MKHLLVTAYFSERCPEGNPDRWIGDVLFGAMNAANAHVRGKIEEQFYPNGKTVLAILEESHAAVSTFWENGYAMFDYFSCAIDHGFDKFVGYLKERGFVVKDEYTMVIDRARSMVIIHGEA